MARIRPTIALIRPSTLRVIRDNGNVLYNRINAQGYKECEDDIQAASGIAEDIRDALLEHQVSDNNTYAAVGKLKLECFYRSPSNARYTIEIAS